MALGIVAVILAMVILGVFIINIAQRECNSNRDCPGNSYCNAKHECVEYPQQVVVKENNLPAAIIIALGLVMAAFVFKSGKLPWKKLKK